MTGRRVTGVTLLAAVMALGPAGCTSDPPTPPPDRVVVPLTTPPQTASTTSGDAVGGASATGWYLAMGDSLAAGYQASTGDQPNRGYAGPVLAGLQATAPGTRLKNVGCSGETTTSMLRGGICTYPEGSQLAAAVAFLRANASSTALVTLDIGANNVLRCARPTVDQACATSSVGTVGSELGTILTQMRSVAPTVPIVVLDYYNPLLAGYLKGGTARTAADQSQPMLTALNQTIAGAADRAGAKVADVAGAFSTTDTSGSPPVNVQRICALTAMCTRADIHANDDGYAVMAKAVLAAR